jgi:hypothetical protein
MPTARRPSLLLPLLLIGLGLLLALQTLHLLPPSLWRALAQLWPVLLVVLGLELLIGPRSARAALAVILAGVALVAASLTWAALRASQAPPGPSETLIQLTQGAARLDAQMVFQTGRLNVSALGPSDHLLEGVAHDGPAESVQQSYTVRDGAGRLALEQHLDPLLAPFLLRRPPSAEWDVLLTRKLPLALTVDAGDGTAAFDFHNLQLTDLDLTAGLGAITVTFAPGQAARAHLRTGLGPATINLPPGFPVRLRLRSGQANVRLPARLSAGLPTADDTYVTPGFDAARPFLDLELSAGLGGVTIQ